MARAKAHASHVEALEPAGFEAFADDQFGAATADVDHEPAAGFAGRCVRHTQVDQSRFLHARDDLDRVSEGLARAVEERALASRLAQGIGADDSYALGPHVAKTLTEALEAGECAGGGLTVQPPMLIEPGGKAHHLAKTVDNGELAQRVARHNHVKAVRPEVDSGKDVWHRRAGRGQAGFRRRTRSRSRRW
jgi:hypothetical protein